MDRCRMLAYRHHYRHPDKLQELRQGGCTVICDLYCPMYGSLQYQFLRDDGYDFRRLRMPPSYHPTSHVAKVQNANYRKCGWNRTVSVELIYEDDIITGHVWGRKAVEELDELQLYDWFKYESPSPKRNPNFFDEELEAGEDHLR